MLSGYGSTAIVNIYTLSVRGSTFEILMYKDGPRAEKVKGLCSLANDYILLCLDTRLV